LLYRLASHLEPVPREQLCFLFWPDLPETLARRNLSHLLTHLRRALPLPDLLNVSEDQVALDEQRVWSDGATFARLCGLPNARRSTLHKREEEVACALAQEAVELYRGPFLAGFSLPGSAEFESWVALERSTWEQLYLSVLAALIEERTAKGEYQAAIAYARRYLEADNLAEDIHRRLIELYAAVGDRSAALRQFECCVKVLERELGVSPLPETRAAYQAALEGRPPEPSFPAVKLAWTTLPGPEVPLVGREEALDGLRRAYARARSGRGGVVLISGEAGMGKSRLMQEFATALSGQALILTGASSPGAQTTPYQPIVEALRGLWTARDADVGGRGERSPSFPPLSSLSPVWLAEASRLLPELRTLYPDRSPAIASEPKEARLRLFEALCRLLFALAGPSTFPRATGPVILCLDDLHWADSATLDWLAYLGRELRDRPVLVIATYRSEEADMVAELRYTLARLGVLSELQLSGLDVPSVRRVVRYLLRAPLDVTLPLRTAEEEEGEGGEVALATRLQEATGGNPFFLLETLKALIEIGTPRGRLSEVGDLPLPDTVREAIERRLRLLSSRARQILEAGAILGPVFGFELVRRTAGRREMEAIDGLEELVARQLLVAEPAAYRFSHESTRRVVEANLSPIRRQLLHRRAGRALEGLAPDMVGALARHFEIARDVRKALHYYGLAAQKAEALFAWREAEEHQGRMLTLLEELDPAASRPDTRAQRARVLMARAAQRYLQGRLVERDADLAALAALAEAGNEALRMQALIHRARYLNLDARYEEALAVAGEGLALAESCNDVVARCALLNQIGFAHYFLGQPREALAALESALAAAPKADIEVRRHIVHTLGYVHFHLGDYERSLACQQTCYADHRTAGDYNGMAWAGLDIGSTYLERGQLTEARQYLLEHLDLARRIGARSAEAYGWSWLGYWELYAGRYLAALECFQQALSLQQEIRTEHGRVAAEVGTGLACYQLGKLAEARRWLKGAVERARPIGHLRRLTEALIGLGLLAIEAGRPPEADRCLREAVALARESECPKNLATALVGLARAERRAGNGGAALSHALEAVQVAQAVRLPACEAWAEMEAGLALLAQGEGEAALKHTARALALLPYAHEGWIGTEEVHLAQAQVLRALGRLEAADEHLRLAEAIVSEKGRS